MVAVALEEAEAAAKVAKAGLAVLRTSRRTPAVDAAQAQGHWSRGCSEALEGSPCQSYHPSPRSRCLQQTAVFHHSLAPHLASLN